MPPLVGPGALGMPPLMGPAGLGAMGMPPLMPPLGMPGGPMVGAFGMPGAAGWGGPRPPPPGAMW